MEDLRKHLVQLVETNHALGSDLDVSRRIVADLSRERDALREELEYLQERLKGLESAKARDSSTEKAIELRLAAEERLVSDLKRERDLLWQHANSTEARAKLAEDRLQTLVAELEKVERERDEAMGELGESTQAMNEIRSCLLDITGIKARPTGSAAHL